MRHHIRNRNLDRSRSIAFLFVMFMIYYQIILKQILKKGCKGQSQGWHLNSLVGTVTSFGTVFHLLVAKTSDSFFTKVIRNDTLVLLALKVRGFATFPLALPLAVAVLCQSQEKKRLNTTCLDYKQTNLLLKSLTQTSSPLVQSSGALLVVRA